MENLKSDPQNLPTLEELQSSEINTKKEVEGGADIFYNLKEEPKINGSEAQSDILLHNLNQKTGKTSSNSLLMS